MPIYALGYKGYAGTDPIVSAIDSVANFLFSFLFYEHMTFLFFMLIFIVIAQGLFEQRNIYLYIMGITGIIFAAYTLFSFMIWVFESANGIWYLDYMLIAEFVVVIFFFVFFLFSVVRIVLHKFERYSWPYLVSGITLVVECGLYQFFYQDASQFLALLVVLFVTFALWLLMKSPPIRNRSILA